jgi:hypothetical protein
VRACACIHAPAVCNGASLARRENGGRVHTAGYPTCEGATTSCSSARPPSPTYLLAGGWVGRQLVDMRRSRSKCDSEALLKDSSENGSPNARKTDRNQSLRRSHLLLSTSSETPSDDADSLIRSVRYPPPLPTRAPAVPIRQTLASSKRRAVCVWDAPAEVAEVHVGSALYFPPITHTHGRGKAKMIEGGRLWSLVWFPANSSIANARAHGEQARLVEMVRRHFLFQGLEEEVLQTMVGQMRRHEFSADDTILGQSAEVDDLEPCIFFLLSGKVDLIVHGISEEQKWQVKRPPFRGVHVGSRYGLPKCRTDWPGVSKRPRELISPGIHCFLIHSSISPRINLWFGWWGGDGGSSKRAPCCRRLTAGWARCVSFNPILRTLMKPD